MKRDDFETWQAKVNSILIKKCGLGIEDLPDYCYWDAWDAGDTPKFCADCVIENAKGY